MEKFAAATGPKKPGGRSLMAQDRKRLYPKNPELEDCSEEVNGWWVGKNYSQGSLDKFIAKAIKMGGLTLGKDAVVAKPAAA